jgi:hypothetical protein
LRWPNPVELLRMEHTRSVTVTKRVIGLTRQR